MKKRTRREFFWHNALAGTAVLKGSQASPKQPSRRSALAFSPYSVTRFLDPLPIPPIAKPAKDSRYRIIMREFYAKVHRDMKPTRFWDYDQLVPGPTIEAECGEPVTVEWVNGLPPRHFLPIDHTLHGAEKSLPEVRTVVHLHGGRTGPESDGYPERWFVPGQSAVCRYPNEQVAAALFYHDHAMGITRLNCLAGLVGLFLVRDRLERSLDLPSAPYEIPLVLFDRSFDLDHQLAYPVSSAPESPWVSDFVGDALLANGKLFPFLNVEPRVYRFRVVNFSNGAIYRLSLSEDKYPLMPVAKVSPRLARTKACCRLQ